MKNPFRNRPALPPFFMAPIFAELFSGSTPLNEFLLGWTYRRRFRAANAV